MSRTWETSAVSANISTGKPAAVLAPTTRLLDSARCETARACNGKSCSHRIRAAMVTAYPTYAVRPAQKIRRFGRPFGGSGLKSLSVLRTTSSRNWKDDINEPRRIEKGIDMIKRFVPRFSPFSDLSRSNLNPNAHHAGVLLLSNESDAPAMREPRTRSRE